MFSPSPEYSPSRPFKIFISLLDKWEIGSLLTEVLVFDCFRALRDGIEGGGDPGNDVGNFPALVCLVLKVSVADNDRGYIVRSRGSTCSVEGVSAGDYHGYYYYQ